MTYKYNTIRLLHILLLIQLSSCHMKPTEYPLIFRNGNDILHNDISIHGVPSVLTEYSSGANLYVVSTWTMNGDTIVAVPRIEYGSNNRDFWYKPIEVTDSTVTSIKKTYIMNGNILVDITDYSPIFLSLGLTQTGDSTCIIEYHRIK